MRPLAFVENETFVRWVDLHRDYPNVSFPVPLTASDLPDGVVMVAESTRPATGRFQVLESEPWPQLVDGRWQMAYKVRDMTESERNERLSAIRAGINDEVQQRLDEFARTGGYDSILSACTYATSGVQRFRLAGQYCVDARDATWEKVDAIFDEVAAGARPAPVGYADIESDLPSLAWPAGV